MPTLTINQRDLEVDLEIIVVAEVRCKNYSLYANVLDRAYIALRLFNQKDNLPGLAMTETWKERYRRNLALPYC
jgi:hypothetical protein